MREEQDIRPCKIAANVGLIEKAHASGKHIKDSQDYIPGAQGNLKELDWVETEKQHIFFQKDVLFFIHSSTRYISRLESIQANTGWEVGHTHSRLPVNHNADMFVL